MLLLLVSVSSEATPFGVVVGRGGDFFEGLAFVGCWAVVFAVFVEAVVVVVAVVVAVDAADDADETCGGFIICKVWMLEESCKMGRKYVETASQNYVICKAGRGEGGNRGVLAR